MSQEVIRRDTLAAFEKALDDAVLVELNGLEAALDMPTELIVPEPLRPGAERRTMPRYSLVEPAVVAVASWNELVALYTKDISCGGMFVETEAPPERDTRVAVQLQLPHGTGTLEFEGMVVHVVTAAQARSMGCTAGFGIQFSDLTAERRRALQRLVEQAKQMADARPMAVTSTLRELGTLGDGGSVRMTLSDAESRQVQELRAELATMTARSDLEVLGLDTAADRNALRIAFERLARRWHPSVAYVEGPPEVRQLTGEIFLRIHEAYRRLRDALASIETVPSQGSRARPARPAPPATATRVPRAAPLAPEPPPRQVSSTQHAPVTLEPLRRPTGETEGIQEESLRPQTGETEWVQDEILPPQTGETERIELGPPTGETQRAADLNARSEQLASQLKRRAPAAAPVNRGSQSPLVDEALRLVAEKKYLAAIERLERALERTPEPRLRVLLCVVQARQALTERDFPRARTHYEAVLELDPENEVAQRELLMLSALQR